MALFGLLEFGMLNSRRAIDLDENLDSIEQLERAGVRIGVAQSCYGLLTDSRPRNSIESGDRACLTKIVLLVLLPTLKLRRSARWFCWLRCIPPR